MAVPILQAEWFMDNRQEVVAIDLFYSLFPSPPPGSMLLTVHTADDEDLGTRPLWSTHLQYILQMMRTREWVLSLVYCSYVCVFVSAVGSTRNHCNLLHSGYSTHLLALVPLPPLCPTCWLPYTQVRCHPTFFTHTRAPTFLHLCFELYTKLFDDLKVSLWMCPPLHFHHPLLSSLSCLPSLFPPNN